MKKNLLLFMLGAFSTMASFAQCGTNYFHGYNGTLNDGSYDQYYQNNSTCYYLIESANGGRIVLGMSYFDTEFDYDFVTVFDGYDENAPVLYNTSGNSVPSEVTSSGNYIFIRFTTDDSQTYNGWDAYYYALPAWHTECAGNISDGFDYYPNLTSAGWVIAPTGADNVTLTFQSLDTEATYDYVYVYDGTDQSGTLLGSWSGQSAPSSFTSPSGAVYIYFSTDVSNTGTGFSLDWQCSTCASTATLTSCAGSIGDGSDSGLYAAYSSCSWLINVPGALGLNFNFTYMDTELDYDFVRIYDGYDANAPLLAIVSGGNLPGGFSSSSGVAFIQFTSDYSNEGQGWSLNYACSTVGVEDTRQSQATLGIYPNPASENITLTFSNDFKGITQLTIFNSMGSIVMKKSTLLSGHPVTTNIDVNELASGTYILTASNGEEVILSRFIVE